jgi:hypothetical protein
MISNTQRRIVNRWYILTLVFLIAIFLPSQIGIDGMDGGFAISFFAGFMVMVGIIIIFIYRSRAKQLDKIGLLFGHTPLKNGCVLLKLIIWPIRN